MPASGAKNSASRKNIATNTRGQAGAAAGRRRRPRSRYSSWWSRCRAARRTWRRSCRRSAPAPCAAGCRPCRAGRRDALTPISVPALSNTSTNRKLKIDDQEGQLRTRARNRAAGRSAPATAASRRCRRYLHEPERQPDRASPTRMPISVPPMILRKLSATISTKPSKAQDRRPLLEVAERDQRRRMVDHDLRLLERDDAEEQPDAGRDRELQVLRDRVDDVFAEPEDRVMKNSTPEQNTTASACCQVYL